MRDNVSQNIKICAKALKRGEIAAFPTDTVYGLGVIPNNDAALKNLFEIKKRPDTNPVVLLFASQKKVFDFALYVSETAGKLAAAFWPGPLTLIIKPKKKMPDILTAGLETVGVRIPSEKTARKLIELSGGALAVTSANISGLPPAVNVEEIRKYFPGLKNIIEHSGSMSGIPSTVVDCSSPDGYKILRQGSITQIMIEEVLSKS